MAKRLAEAALLPQWTRYVATDLSGRDPLGLSGVAQALADYWMPGIITQTDRARYYGLYCWILWHIEHEEKPKNDESFLEAFHRRETAIALSTMIHDPDSSPVGKRKVQQKLRESGEKEEIATSFQVLGSDPLGGYGAYYSGCLYKLGLTHRPEGGYDRVTPGFAEELAREIQKTVSATPYVAERLFSRSRVPFPALKKSSGRMGLDAISAPFAEHEREKLIVLFFGFGRAEGDPSVSRRRLSLAHILDLLHCYERAGIAVEESSLDRQLVYSPTYFGVLASTKGANRRMSTVPMLEECRSFWRQFCLHQYLTWAIEGLLCGVLDLIDARPGGQGLDEIVTELAGRDFEAFLSETAGGSCGTPHKFLSRLGVRERPTEEACLEMRKRLPLAHPLSEESLSDAFAKRPSEAAALSVLLLGVLYGKWRGAREPAWRHVTQLAGNELSAPTVLPMMDTWTAPKTTWEEALRFLVENLVLRQHDRVMYSKGKLESCWLHAEEGRYVKDQDYEPYFRASRHWQSVSILRDLALVERDSKGRVRTTDRGRAILKKVLSEGG